MLLLALPLLAFPVNGQSNAGVNFASKSPARMPNPSKPQWNFPVTLSNFRRSFSADDAGLVLARNLPFGLYRLRVQQEGFAPYDGLIEIHSVLPTEYAVKLSIAALSTAVQVSAQNTASRS